MPRNLENAQVQGKFSYTIGKELGSGSFGAVHRVTRRDGEERAMKISFESSNPVAIFQFAQEAYKTQALKHDNIIPIDDLHHFELEGKPYFFFTMPLANRGSLRSFAPHGTIVDPETGVPLLSQAAEGIHHGHTQKIIHRDVKPENILLDERENPSQPGTTYLHVLVSDLGISVWGHGDKSFVKHGTGGTLPYMAPEQFEGEARPESDQYGLAVVTHELLTGQRPYTTEKGLKPLQQLIRFKQLHQDAPVPPFGNNVLQRNPALLSEIEKVVKKGMSKNPGERYPSTQAFGQALRKVLTDYILSEEAEKQRKVFEAAKPQQIDTDIFAKERMENEAEAFMRKGLLFFKQKNYEEALSAFNQVIKLNPKYRYAYHNKGFALEHLGRKKEALQYYEKALEIDPSNFLIQEKVNRLKRQQEEPQPQKGPEINPSLPLIPELLRQGDVLLKQKNYEEALQLYDRVVRYDPRNASALNKKGNALKKLGRLDEAKAAYEQAKKNKPRPFREAIKQGFEDGRSGRKTGQ